MLKLKFDTSYHYNKYDFLWRISHDSRAIRRSGSLICDVLYWALSFSDEDEVIVINTNCKSSQTDAGPYLDEFYCVTEDIQQMSLIYDKFALSICHKNFSNK